MFLSHLDNPRYKLAVKECEVAIIHLPTIPTIYVVPEIAGTIDQLRSASLPTDTTTKCALIRPTSDWETRDSSQRPHTRHIRCPASYCENDDISLDQYNEYVDPDKEPPGFARFVVAEAETLVIEVVEVEADSLGTVSEGVEPVIETVRPLEAHATCAICQAITHRTAISS